MDRVTRAAYETAASVRRFRLAEVVDALPVEVGVDGVVRTDDLGGVRGVLVSSIDTLGSTTVVWSGTRGAEISRHRHSLSGQVLYVLSGVISVAVDSRRPVVLQRGDRMHLPPGTVHGGRILEAAEYVTEHRPGLRLQVRGDRRWLRGMTSSS